MKFLLCTLITVLFSFSSFSKELNKKYKILSPDGKESGRYEIKTTSIDGNKVEISETISISYRGKPAGLKTVITYSETTPLNAVAKTKLEGKPCMEGTVKFNKQTYSFSGTGFLDKRSGEVIKPKGFSEEGLQKPDGILLFTPTIPTIGPQLLKEEGIVSVTYVEFPDDIGAPELIGFKEGF